VEVAIMSMQARILLIVLLGSLGLGLWADVPPATAAWRAALLAAGATWLAGHLLRLVAEAIQERAAEAAAGPVAAPIPALAAPPRPSARERR
jgi:hypothetical protein